ncbi:hypothetical protein PAXINDRAFT_16140 [Paxillus involutus ATCC 200175]|uniref:Uncharacterized protein n=1 Tax=Paxillus involutus ATCC 200175 TaxID=664439 RepID=A0A0C9TSS8_PAXIN|nr:hypothetical protein PAXINDRAFT_16140 [Paxillus involutus ATCC 200175]
MPYLNSHSIQRLWTVDHLTHLYLEEDVHSHILIEPIKFVFNTNNPFQHQWSVDHLIHIHLEETLDQLHKDAPVTAHKIIQWPTLEGTWLEHPDHSQNLAALDIEGPTGLSDIYIDETTLSVLEAINLPAVTQAYDDIHLSRCLIHHQGYKKSSIGSKYKIHYSLRTDEDDYDIHPFHYTNRLLDPNDHENPPSSTWDVPTIQRWNEVVDADARRRYWALRGGVELHERMARRSEMLATAIADNATLPWNKKRKYAQLEEEVLDIIRQEGSDHKKSFQALLQIVPNLLKLKVHPLTPLPHWMRDPYVIGDSLYPEAVFQPITGLELPLWSFLNTRLISKDAIFPYANAQNLLNRIHLYKDDDVTVLNPHFFPILNLRTIESDNDRTWTNTYINLSLSFQQEFGFDFFDSIDLSLTVPLPESPVVIRNAESSSNVSRTPEQTPKAVQRPLINPQQLLPINPQNQAALPLPGNLRLIFEEVTDFICIGLI